jgi:hypothetical protein
LLATRRRASLYIGGVWIREPKELRMKRLLGLLLLGMVGCGQKENAGNAVDPSIGADEQLLTDLGEKKERPSNPSFSNATSTPVETDDPVVALEKLGARIERKRGEVVAVDFPDGNFTDAGLMHLKGMTNLETLDLHGTKVTDGGLVHLRGLNNLLSIDLRFINVTNAGLVHLKELTSLQTLKLHSTKVTNAGLVHLNKLTNLILLDLRGTQVTDAGLVHLKGLSNLKTLGLFDSQVSAAGVADQQQALPHCVISNELKE